MRKKFIKKGVCSALFIVLFSILTIVTEMLPLRAESGSEAERNVPIKASFKISDFSDTTYNKYTVIRNIYYAGDRDGASRGNHSAGDKIPMYDITFSDGSCHVAYCIEPGEDVNAGWSYRADDESGTEDLQWKNLKENYPYIAENIQIVAGSASAYESDKEARAAAQIIIWELVSGMRDVNSGVVTDTYLKDCMDGAGDFDKYYELFDNAIDEYRRVPTCLLPSKQREPYVLHFDEKSQVFCLTLEDIENPYFKYVDWEGLTGLKVAEVTDTKVILQSCEYSYDVINCEGYKDTSLYYDVLNPFYVINSYRGEGRGQALVSGCASPSVPISFSYRYENVGTLNIFKNSEDGNLSGIEFVVKPLFEDGESLSAVTDENGFATLYLKAGSYEVCEIVPHGYNDVLPKTVEITSDNATNVLFYNSLIKYYNLEVNYFERSTGEKLSDSVYSVLIEGSSYDLYEKVMYPIDGYIWDGYEGDEYMGENLSENKVIDVYYVTMPAEDPVEKSEDTPSEKIPDTGDSMSRVFFAVITAIVIVVPNFIYRKNYYVQ